jgi:hypothetical protein
MDQPPQPRRGAEGSGNGGIGTSFASCASACSHCSMVGARARATNWNRKPRPDRLEKQALGCTMRCETNPDSLATPQPAWACLAGVTRLQRTESFVQECSASPGYQFSFGHHHYLCRGPAGLSSHGEWQQFCFVFGRGHQRNDVEYPGPEPSAVGGHDHDRLDLRSWNRKRDGHYTERKLGRSWLHQRRNQPSSRPEYYLRRSGSRTFRTCGRRPYSSPDREISTALGAPRSECGVFNFRLPPQSFTLPSSRQTAVPTIRRVVSIAPVPASRRRFR